MQLYSLPLRVLRLPFDLLAAGARGFISLWSDLALPATSTAFGINLTWAVMYAWNHDWLGAVVFGFTCLALLVAVGGLVQAGIYQYQYFAADDLDGPNQHGVSPMPGGSIRAYRMDSGVDPR